MTNEMKKILHADDDPIVREMVECYLEAKLNVPYTLRQVSDARQLYENASKEKWDLIITDMNMPPYETGYDAIKKIRGDGNVTPVIIFSGQYGALEIEATKLPNVSHLSKSRILEMPKNIETLLAPSATMSPVN